MRGSGVPFPLQNVPLTNRISTPPAGRAPAKLFILIVVAAAGAWHLSRHARMPDASFDGLDGRGHEKGQGDTT